jgi:hypothetical protein
MTVTLSQVLEIFHVENFSNASDEEAMFFFRLFFRLCANAKSMTQEGDGKCDRACQALILALEGITGPPDYSVLRASSE